MSNYIKIPLASNPGRSFIAQALSGTATGGGTVAGTGASAAQNLVGGSGSGATATVTKGVDATIATATITIVSIGEGYKVGDVVTIAILSSGGATTWDAEISYTILAADLVASTGSATNEYAMIPVDNVACVHEDSATSAIIQLKQIVSGGSGTGDGPIMQYAVTMDDTPAISKEQLWADISAAIAKAASAENSQPEVKFTNDAECLSVVLS
jgi:hypothetical protein